MNLEAEVLEIFPTIQGEGIYVGRPQVFIRFGLCNMRCRYCDVPERDEGVVTPLEEVKREIQQAARQHQIGSVSLTGGEPLLHVRFLKLLMPWLKASGFQTYLETNGTLPAQFKEVIEWSDVIAMDIKLPSATHDYPSWEAHRQFLKIGKVKDLFVKIVLTNDVLEHEFLRAVDLIAEVDPHIPLVLQPVSPCGEVRETASFEQLMAFYAMAKRRLLDVRLIPQVHKLMGIK